MAADSNAPTTGESADQRRQNAIEMMKNEKMGAAVEMFAKALETKYVRVELL